MSSGDDASQELVMLKAELHEVRRILAATAARLAETETSLYRMQADTEWLRGDSARADQLMREVNSLRYRCEQAEAAVARLRGSLSWSVTRPIRWVGSQYSKYARRRR